jgi:predicted metal-dependent hydrolase
VTRAVEQEAERLGVRYGRISIRDQRTRWGSCSARGDLSFNWRLVLAPERVLDYVVVHELCHRRRRDHSPAIWRLVADARPGYLDEKRWLGLHGRELLEYRSPQGSGTRSGGTNSRRARADSSASSE